MSCVRHGPLVDLRFELDFIGRKRRFFCTDLRSFSRTARSLEISSEEVASEEVESASGTKAKSNVRDEEDSGEESCKVSSSSLRTILGSERGGGFRGAMIVVRVRD